MRVTEGEKGTDQSVPVPVFVRHSVTDLRFSPAARFETRAVAESGLIEGFASTFNGPPDSHGDIVSPGAFAASLREHAARGTAPAMLWSHKPSEPIGRWIDLQETRDGLLVTGKLNLESTRGRDAYAHLKAGDVTGLSIGFQVAPGGQEYRGDVRVLKSVDLAEISIVSMPANRDALITAVKSRAGSKPQTIRELERALRDMGFSQKEASGIALHGWRDADSGSELREAVLAIREFTQQLKGA
ncbi:HK97 family phage prohead protease [Cupriavidus sp. DB3]|uniref:HK97 family phage prohead protease n=1 Tax=Cupriavidus sp. DB3 TaxID=2873259 RepID=UPI001CF3AAC3|nr:HK97 family phage prohead protease [Cupriavidus sp. DB3]MCA7084070.1 HK97 family phage prohead protease [Cupriavidus sp. DB3]